MIYTKIKIKEQKCIQQCPNNILCCWGKIKCNKQYIKKVVLVVKLKVELLTTDRNKNTTKEESLFKQGTRESFRSFNVIQRCF